MKIIKITGVLGLLAVLAFAYVWFFVYNKSHRDIAGEKPAYELSSQELQQAFEDDIEAANQKFGDETVLITGAFIELDGDDENAKIILNGAVCAMKENPNQEFEVDQELTIKGRVTGFDDLFGDVRLSDCTLQ